MAEENKIIVVSREELIRLLVDCKQAQATIQPDEIVYLEDFSNHQTSDQRQEFVEYNHSFEAKLIRNNNQDAASVTIKLIEISPTLFVGSLSVNDEEIKRPN